MKIVVSDAKDGKSYQVEVGKDKAGQLLGVKIGEKVDGGIVGAAGYRLQVTGGSDSDGIPMRPDVKGTGRAAALIGGGIGLRATGKGLRKRKNLRGSTISTSTQQVNTKVLDYGEKPLAELFPQKPKEKKEKEAPKPAGKKKKK